MFDVCALPQPPTSGVTRAGTSMVEAESTESSFSLEAPGTSREKKTKEAIAFRSGKRTLRHSEQGREEEERGSRGTIQEKYRPNG